MANDERHAQIPIIPSRGALLDTNGNPLAVSVRYDSVYVLGTLVGGADKADKLAATLGPVLGMPTADVRAAIDPRSDRPVVLRSSVPSAVAEQVQRLALPGVYLDKEPIRQYPEGSLAAQVLGYVGEVPSEELPKLEKRRYDDVGILKFTGFIGNILLQLFTLFRSKKQPQCSTHGCSNG